MKNIGIVKTFNQQDFIKEFEVFGRKDNFSYKGLRALFDSLNDMVQDTGQNIEMDVIALCCEFSELSADDVITDCCLDLEGLEDDYEDKDHLVTDYLNDNTMLLDSYDIDGVTYFLFSSF